MGRTPRVEHDGENVAAARAVMFGSEQMLRGVGRFSDRWSTLS
jgi:hypothetical protein